MTDMIIAMQAEPRDIALCLSDIDGFESIIARMPTPEECRDQEFSPDLPVLVMRLRGGRNQVYRADLVALTISSDPPPTPDTVHDAARYILRSICEDLDNALADLSRLDEAVSASPRKVVTMAAEVRRRREDERGR
jgi:hypothetical protein